MTAAPSRCRNWSGSGSGDEAVGAATPVAVLPLFEDSAPPLTNWHTVDWSLLPDSNCSSDYYYRYCYYCCYRYCYRYRC